MFDAFKSYSQKRKFRPNVLNYLNATFTFGKLTKDNFINRKVQCRPIYSLIHLFSCPLFLWEGSREQQHHEEIALDQQQFQIVLLAPHQDGTKKSWRCNYAT